MTESPGESLTRRAFRRWLGLVLLGGQVVLGAIGLAVWWWTPDAPVVPPQVEVAGTVVRPATLESGLAVAWDQARAWKAGARLLSATMQVDWPWDAPSSPVRRLPGTGWLTYVFVAPWQPPGRPAGAASLSILVERLTGGVASQTTLGWEAAPDLPPAPASPAVSSTAAILTAEAAGGTGFRAACPIDRHLTRVSLVAETDLPPHWLVTYEDARQPARHGFVVRVDAATAEIISVDGEAPACGETL